MTARGVERDAADNETPVVGWQACCTCGWVGLAFHARPPHGTFEDASDALVAGPIRQEWEAHIDEALPQWGVQDAALRFEQAQRELSLAVLNARNRGVSWSNIATLARPAGVEYAEDARARWEDGI